MNQVSKAIIAGSALATVAGMQIVTSSQAKTAHADVKNANENNDTTIQNSSASSDTTTENNAVKAEQNNDSQVNVKSVNSADSNKQVQNTANSDNNGGYDAASWGKLDVDDWTLAQNGSNYLLTNYTGDKAHIIIPNNQDFTNAGRITNGSQVEINRDTLYNLMHSTDANLQGKSTLAISKTGNGKVKASAGSWKGVFSNTKNDSTLSSNFNLNNLDTSSVTDLQGAFEYNHLTNLDGISNWNTSNVTNLKMAFAGNDNSNINALSKWDTAKVNDLSYAFADNSKLTDLSGIAGWNVRNATNVSPLVEGDDGNDASVKYLDLSAWNPQDSNFAGKTISRAIPDLKGAIWVLPKNKVDKGIEFKKEYVSKWMDQTGTDEETFLTKFIQNGDTSNPDAIFSRAFDYINSNFNTITFSNGDTAHLPFLITDLNTADKQTVANHIKDLAMQAAKKEQQKLGSNYEVTLDSSIDASDPVALANAKFTVKKKVDSSNITTTPENKSNHSTSSTSADPKLTQNVGKVDSSQNNGTNTTNNSNTSNSYQSGNADAKNNASHETSTENLNNSTTHSGSDSNTPGTNVDTKSDTNSPTTPNTTTSANKESNVTVKGNKIASNNHEKVNTNASKTQAATTVDNKENKAAVNKNATNSNKTRTDTNTTTESHNTTNSLNSSTLTVKPKMVANKVGDNQVSVHGSRIQDSTSSNKLNTPTMTKGRNTSSKINGQQSNAYINANGIKSSGDSSEQAILPQTGNASSLAGVLAGSSMLATMAALGIAHKKHKNKMHF